MGAARVIHVPLPPLVRAIAPPLRRVAFVPSPPQPIAKTSYSLTDSWRGQPVDNPQGQSTIAIQFSELRMPRKRWCIRHAWVVYLYAISF